VPDLKTRVNCPTLPETLRLKIAYRRVDDFNPYAGNARTHSDKQITQIAASIRQFGFTNPVLDQPVLSDPPAFRESGRLQMFRPMPLASLAEHSGRAMFTQSEKHLA